MKHIKLFETTAAYNAATLDLPNVSLVEETMSVGYKPWVETKLVCKYNVTDISNPIPLRANFEQNIFKSMEIDGVMLDELVTEYTFGTTGVHTVKYELYDETKLGGNQAPVFNNSNLVECIIPDGVTSIGIRVFMNCTGLTRVTIGNGVTSIADHAFEGCSSLTSVTIGNNVTSIGSQAFYGCSGLTNIVIPSSVISIGDWAFCNCNDLISIVSNVMTAPTIQYNTFQNVKANGILTVPSGSTGYDVWMGTDNYYLGSYNWTKVEQ